MTTEVECQIDTKQQQQLTDQERALLFLRACEILGMFSDDELQQSARIPETNELADSTDSTR
jgi:hypothetical protein